MLAYRYMQKQQQTVFVGLSGGVDSSVAALRLHKKGYNVVGVFIKVWHPSWLECNWREERLDAMRVAAKLNIPFLTCDAQKEYKDDVAYYFISEYKAGRTPNPDVMCNKYVKFGAFLRFAEEKGADYVATGHYAQRIIKSKGSDPLLYEMHRGVDTGKDQTYFLWTLTQQQLAKILFPVGDSPKKQIRKEAQEAGLLTAEKKDSQGVCFLGHIDIPEFLSHYMTLQPGEVLNTQGAVIGTHKGALVYTLGQRHGFVLHSEDTQRTAMYVVARDIEKNTITVDAHKPHTTSSHTLTLTDVNLLTHPDELLQPFEMQIRYRQTPVPCTAQSVHTDTLTITTNTDTDTPAIGQSCVLYRGTQCLGGGIIS